MRCPLSDQTTFLMSRELLDLIIVHHHGVLAVAPTAAGPSRRYYPDRRLRWAERLDRVSSPVALVDVGVAPGLARLPHTREVIRPASFGPATDGRACDSASRSV